MSEERNTPSPATRRLINNFIEARVAYRLAMGTLREDDVPSFVRGLKQGIARHGLNKVQQQEALKTAKGEETGP